MSFKIRWNDIVRKHCDTATNGQATIMNLLDSHDTYRIEVAGYEGSNALIARTAEGVDLMLEEFCIRNSGWRKL